MHRTINQTFSPFSGCIPVLRMLFSIRPFRSFSSIERKSRLSAVVSKLNSKRTNSWKLEELAIWRITAAIVLEPPLGLRKLVERVHGCVAVCVVDAGVATFAVQTCGPCR
jgi:hypothetical protein